MNDRMTGWLDLLAQREREEEAPGYMEILPPLHAEIGRRSGFEPFRFATDRTPAAAFNEEFQEA